MSTDTKVDILFVRKVLEFVENEHSDFKHEQSTFFMTPELAETMMPHGVIFVDEKATTFPQAYGQNCKTAACIAGTACMLDPDTTFTASGTPQVNGQDVVWDQRAAQLLGLDLATANSIFWEMDEQDAIDKLRDHLTHLEWREKAGLL